MRDAISRTITKTLLSRSALPAFAGLLTAVGLVAMQGLLPASVERLHLATFDAYERLSPRQRGPASVVVVDVDDESLRHVGQWPWSRRTMATLVDGLRALGASVIGFDMVFSEPDRTSPSVLLPEWQKQFGFRSAVAPDALPDNDAMLAQAFGHGRVVTGFGVLPAGTGALPATLTSIATIGGNPVATIANFGGAVANLPVLDAAAAGRGSFTVPGGADQIIRRVPLIMAVGNRVVPSLTLELLRVQQDEDTIKVRAEHWNGVTSGYTVRVGDLDLPLDAAGYYWIHHPAPRSTATVPAWQILESQEREANRAKLKGAVVMVGTSAVGLVDLRPTPLSAFEPGVNINASVVEQALDGHHLVRPIWASNLEILSSAGLAMLVLGLVVAGHGRTAWLLGLGGSVAAVIAGYQAFVGPGLLFDPLPFILCLAATLVVTSMVRYAVNEQAALRLRKAFTHYLSPDLVTALVRQPDRLKLGGESREMTFLFTDLEGFTSLTEREGAEALVSLLNAYLDNLCRIAMDHGGTVDKIVGDAMHVMFNAPLDQPDHASRAVACARDLDAFASGFAAAQRQAGLAFGATRIGINTGRAVVGNFGGSRRFDYTAHGDAINTAARLESANKTLGTRICVAQATVDQAPGHDFRPVGTLLLKGKSVGIDVHELLTNPEGAGRADHYRSAFARFVEGDEDAAAELVRLHREHPDDPVLRLHAGRIASGELSTRIAA